MTLERSLSLAVLLALAAPAQASWTRMGSMNWRFDDVTVEDASGRARRSEWYQGYDLSVLGPLVHPVAGDMRSSFNFADGADVNSIVNASSVRQQILGWRVGADLFRPYVRRFFRFSPNFSQTAIKQPGSAAGESVSSSWGLSAGLSLPRLPALSFSRSRSRAENTSTLSPTDQRATVQTESASWGLGPLRAAFSHETHDTEDALGSGTASRDDQKRASLETNLYDLKKVPLQSLSWRADFLRFDANGLRSQDQVVNSLNLRSKPGGRGPWKTSLGYWNSVERDLLGGLSTLSHSALLDSGRQVSRGNLTNSLSLSHGAARASTLGANEALSTSLSFASGTVTTMTGASGGWSRTSQGAASLSDGLSAQIVYSPRRTWSVFGEGATNGARVLEGPPGGSRSQRLGTGVTTRLPFYLQGSARFDRTVADDYGAGSRSTSDQLFFQATGSPRERLFTTAGYSLGFVRTEPGGRSASRSLQGSLEYMFLSGLHASAEATYTGSAYSATAGAGYSIGRTDLSIKYHHRELSTRSAFSHLSVALTRSF